LIFQSFAYLLLISRDLISEELKIFSNFLKWLKCREGQEISEIDSTGILSAFGNFSGDRVFGGFRWEFFVKWGKIICSKII